MIWLQNTKFCGKKCMPMVWYQLVCDFFKIHSVIANQMLQCHIHSCPFFNPFYSICGGKNPMSDLCSFKSNIFDLPISRKHEERGAFHSSKSPLSLLQHSIVDIFDKCFANIWQIFSVHIPKKKNCNSVSFGTWSLILANTQ